jgi:hypothetical protein
MEWWTVAVWSKDEYRLHINFGGPDRYWCRFDFQVMSSRELDGVEVRLAADADSVTTEWFPHLQRGMLQGFEESRRRGRAWVRLLIFVDKITAHPVDTTAFGCEQYGRHFVLEGLPSRGFRLGDNGETYAPPTTAEELLDRYALGERLFPSCDLDDAKLTGATLTDAVFDGSWFHSTTFDGADLRGARFESCNVKCASFRRADLRGASFRLSAVEGTDFEGAQLDGASFEGAGCYGGTIHDGDGFPLR